MRDELLSRRQEIGKRIDTFDVLKKFSAIDLRPLIRRRFVTIMLIASVADPALSVLLLETHRQRRCQDAKMGEESIHQINGIARARMWLESELELCLFGGKNQASALDNSFETRLSGFVLNRSDRDI